MNTIKPTELQAGDILAIHTPGKLLPFMICLFLWLWSVIKYKKIPKWKSVKNHGMLMHFPGKISEAIGRGYVRRMFMEHYSDKLKYFTIFRLKNPFDTDEIEKLQAKSQLMADENIEYQFLNFFYWIPFIISGGRWEIFPDKAKTVFCFKVFAILYNAARPGFFYDVSTVNTVDLQNDDRFEQLYFK